MKDKIRIRDALNCFKLLALIILTYEIRVIYLLAYGGTLDKMMLSSHMDGIIEYIAVSIALYIIGFSLWLITEKIHQKKQ